MIRRVAQIVLAALFIAAGSSAQAQEKQIRERAADAVRELEKGDLTLRFFDALTGKPITKGTADIESVGKRDVAYDGTVTFPPPANDGAYRVEFRAEGYITSVFPIEIQVGSLFFNRFSVSPIMDIDRLRVVLDWDKDPRDLDAHFVKAGSYHISYRDMKTAADGEGQLDRDDLDSYGPETITVRLAEAGASYVYYVHNYTDRANTRSTALSKSKATVKVYGNGQLLGVYSVPRQQAGTRWEVFRIEGGKVVPTGALGN
jgi:hypothetical protein